VLVAWVVDVIYIYYADGQLNHEDAEVLVNVLYQPCAGIDPLVDVRAHIWGVWGVLSVWL
jgi:hypothetical protein